MDLLLKYGILQSPPSKNTY